MKKKRSDLTGFSFLWLAGIIVAGYLFLLIVMYLFQSHFVFYPSKEMRYDPQDIGLTFEDLFLETEDGLNLHGWYVPAEDSRATILFFHGNAGNISHRLESIRIFHKLGLNVLIFDYRGYGKSEGKPSEAGTYIDALTFWKYVTEIKNQPPEKIILFGRSLGGAVAAWLGARVDAGGVVLESTFTSAVDLAREIYPFLPVNALMHIQYPVSDYLVKIQAPLLILHSIEDEIIPWHHGKKLYEAAGHPKMMVEMRGGHNDGFLVTGAEYYHAWDAYLKKHGFVTDEMR